MSPLRKLPRRPPESGMYEAVGALDGLVPGRRVVKDLEVRRLDGRQSEAGLTPLTAFGDLTILTMTDVRDVDLTPLRELDLMFLRIEGAAAVDLGRLEGLRPGLRALQLLLLDEDCVVPPRLVLPPTLEQFVIGDRGAARNGPQVAAVLDAVDWSALSDLKMLNIRVGGIGEPLVEVDLGFLRELPKLDNLWVTGVRHIGPAPSPVEPPFDGLSRGLQRVIFEAADPGAAEAAMRRYVTVSDDELQISVRPLSTAVAGEAEPPWTITEPIETGGHWFTYGSLADHAGDGRESTEYDALTAARRALRAADPALLRRLDFDPESSGTTILATSRDDLATALSILGIDSA
jgi:hypothetical protein